MSERPWEDVFEIKAPVDSGYGAEGGAPIVKANIPKKEKGTKPICKFLRNIGLDLLQLSGVFSDISSAGSGQVLVAGRKGLCQVTTEGKVTWSEIKAFANAEGAVRLSERRVCVAQYTEVFMISDGKWHKMLPGEFSGAIRLAQYGNHLLVLDNVLKKVLTLTFDVPSRVVLEIDLQRAVGFTDSWGLCVLPSCGRIAVSDGDQVALFDGDGTLVRLIGGSSEDRVTLKGPEGLCSDDDDHIIVAECKANRLSVFTSDGDFVSHLCEGQVEDPFSVCITPDGHLVCSELGKGLKVFEYK